jgi:hypothetical protein
MHVEIAQQRTGNVSGVRDQMGALPSAPEAAHSPTTVGGERNIKIGFGGPGLPGNI